MRAVWVALIFTFTSALGQGNPVRIRAASSPSFNSSSFGSSNATSVTSTQNTGSSTTVDSRNTLDTTSHSLTVSEIQEPSQTSCPDAITHTTLCISSVETLTDSIPETVYVTVDGFYEVSVTASNVSVVAPTIYDTPLQACTTTIVPGNRSDGLLEPVPSAFRSLFALTFAHPPPPPPSQNFPTQTSTIVVTKKTPVIVSIPTNQGPPVTFPTPGSGSVPTTALPQQDGNPKATLPRQNGASPDNTGNSSPTQIPRPTPTIDGVLMTVGPSNVIGSQTIYTQAPSVITTEGITATIGASLAVIAGTTYRIGSDAPPITLTINGQTIAVGADGVAFSGPNPTTYVPAATIANGYEIVTANSLTISIDHTLAVISGTTYRVGTGATSTTVNIDGIMVTIGPSGVVLPSITVKPTTVPSDIVTSSSSTTLSLGPPYTTRGTTSSSGGSRLAGIGLVLFDMSSLPTLLLALLPFCFS